MGNFDIGDPVDFFTILVKWLSYKNPNIGLMTKIEHGNNDNTVHEENKPDDCLVLDCCFQLRLGYKIDLKSFIDEIFASILVEKLPEIITFAAQRSVQNTTEKSKSHINILPELDHISGRFKIFGVIMHTGEDNIDHYIAYCCHLYDTNCCCKYDDDCY